MKFPDYLEVKETEVQRRICNKLKCTVCFNGLMYDTHFEKGKLYTLGGSKGKGCVTCCFECNGFKNRTCAGLDESELVLIMKETLFLKYKKEYKKLLKRRIARQARKQIKK